MAEKAYSLAVDIVKIHNLLNSIKQYHISKQLLRSGTSICANIEEASAAASRKAFILKLTIASKEARETHFWLKLIRDSKTLEGDIEKMIKRAHELVKLTTASVKTAQLNSMNNNNS
jgi:four helix bundle protein